MRGPGDSAVAHFELSLIFPPCYSWLILSPSTFLLSLPFRGHSEGIGCIHCLTGLLHHLVWDSFVLIITFVCCSKEVHRGTQPPGKWGSGGVGLYPALRHGPFLTGPAIDHGDIQNPLLSQAHSNPGCLLSTLFVSASTYPQHRAGVRRGLTSGPCVLPLFRACFP